MFQQHNEIAREISDRNGEASSLGNLGITYNSLGQYQRAIAIGQAPKKSMIECSECKNKPIDRDAENDLR